jgi:hypothetical protein
MEEQETTWGGGTSIGSMAGRRATKPDPFNLGWVYIRKGGVYMVPNKF